MRLIFFGAPGVGKGTQSQIISEKVGSPQISTGVLLRAAVEAETEAGLRAAKFMEEGQLVPDELIIHIISEVLKEPENKNGFILDGFPRTLRQAEGLDQMFHRMGTGLDKVIQIKVPEETIVARLVNRRICSSCGNEYNLISKPIPEDGICAKCGNDKFIHRNDDNEETIRKRLEVYTNKTEPVLNYYRAAGKLAQVKGDEDIFKVTGYILEVLNTR